MTGPAAGVADLATPPRWIAWKLVNDNKVPRDPHTGNNASSTNPATWGTLDAARILAERQKLAGVGVVFNADGLGGVDLDACRQPDTGEVAEWAMALASDFASYTEISPSGTGLKIYARGAPARLPANKISMDGPPIGDKLPQIEAYVTGRWFAVTGQHFEGTPDEIVEAPEAWERLAYRLRQTRAGTSKAKAEIPPQTATTEELAKLLAFHLAADSDLASLWEGRKETGDTSASGKDAALVARLFRAGADHELIGHAFYTYQHGQIAAGKLKGKRAAKRLVDLIAFVSAPGDSDSDGDLERWNEELHRNDRGEARDIIHNVTLILRKDDRFQGRLRWNQMLEAVEAQQLPWRSSRWQAWTDADDIFLAQWCQQRHAYVKRP